MDKKMIIECETVTPLLMHGADGKTPELRPASIKGVMRFWWRAIHGNLPLKELREKEGEIFGNTERKSSFSIKIGNHKFRSKKIPKGYKFDIEFLLSNRCDFDVKSFFELVVILGLFGQKGKGKQKTQGAIKIIKIDKKKYTKTVDIDYIDSLLKKFTSNFSKEKFEIKYIKNEEKYPMVKNISISRDDKLYINFIHSQKIKTIKKDLKAYNG
jgi:CRISPR-associated protein Cmr1